MTTSTTIRSGGLSTQRRQAAWPSAASVTANPSSSRLARISVRTTGSSSTIRIVARAVTAAPRSRQLFEAFGDRGQLGVERVEQVQDRRRAGLARRIFDLLATAGE